MTYRASICGQASDKNIRKRKRSHGNDAVKKIRLASWYLREEQLRRDLEIQMIQKEIIEITVIGIENHRIHQ